MIPDRTLHAVREGYLFGAREARRRGGADAVTVRLLGVPFTLLRGRDGARAFYDGAVMRRRGAMPRRVANVLFGRGSVHALDGDVHRHRKAMHLSILAEPRVRGLRPRVEDAWRAALPEWEASGPVVLFDAVGEVLCRAVTDWAGLGLDDAEVQRLTPELRAMVEGAPAVGPRHLRGRIGRWRSERWARRVVRDVRAGRRRVPEGSATAVISAHTDPDGRLADARTAAVELLNVVRPAVAVDRLVVFAALALEQHPQWRRRVLESDEDLDRFVLEVRRHAPFVPVLAARAYRPTTVDGTAIPAGRRVLLDVFGTDHDERRWPRAGEFDPDRFAGRDIDPFELVPQGGGDHATGHRCPGEWATTALLGGCVRMLAGGMTYRVPAQDLFVPPHRLLGLPRSRFVIDGVRSAASAGPGAALSA